MWVEEASEVDISNITRFFTNQQYDKESGLYYYNARYYDPHLGSFITPDPAMANLNHYAYCSANPIQYTDPTGLSEITPEQAIVACGTSSAPQETSDPPLNNTNNSNNSNLTREEKDKILNNGLNLIDGYQKYLQSLIDLGKKENIKDEKAIKTLTDDILNDNIKPILSEKGLSDDLKKTLSNMDPLKEEDWIKARDAFIKSYGDIFDKEIKQYAFAMVVSGLSIIGAGIANNINQYKTTTGSTKTVNETINRSKLENMETYKKNISEHVEKLEKFRNDPTVRPGMEHLSEEVIKNQQQIRINHLESEIRTFFQNIQKIFTGKL